MAEYINITTLNRLAKQALAQCEPLSDLILCGEVSNFTRHYKSGHLYFTLKDEQCAVKAVMFRDKARQLSFEPQNGMLVLAYGSATLYERDGSFQVYVEYLRPFGAGAAQMAFDALKKKLAAEGLFAPGHKKPLPPIPRCIGLVTSKTGAALQDVAQVIGRRWPLVRLLLAPVSVQGLAAEQSIVAGIRVLDADPRTDLILVTRGGGSKEDLWVFNSERIARAAYACRKPLVSAVGHEIDYTILDYVADLRAPTPSAAAELCVPDKAGIQQEIYILGKNIQKSIQSRYQLWYNTLSVYAAADLTGRERAMLARRTAELEQYRQEAARAARSCLNSGRRQLQSAAALAEGVSPYAVLARGYAILSDPAGRDVRVETLTPGQKITVRGAKASAACTVDAVRPADARTGEQDENTQKL